MINTIQQALAQLGLSAKKRAIHVQFSNTVLNQQLYLQRIDGTHEINNGFSAQLICLSTDASIPLKQLIGSQVAVDTITDRGEFFRCSGIVTAASIGASDGALTIYQIKMSDASALWHKRRNSRVFMSKSVLEVVECVFKEWQQRSALFAASLSLDLSAIQQHYDIRPFIMQSNETDYAFVTRLLREEGINWLIDEAQLLVSNPQVSIQPQLLRLLDDQSQFKALDRRSIHFQRSSATERSDSMTAFVAQRSLQPTAVHVQRWQPDALEQQQGAGSVLSNHRHSDQHDNNSLALESAWNFSPAWMQDLNAEDQTTASGNSQIERINQNLSNAYASQAKQFVAHSTVRDAQVGYWFEFNGHPEIDLHSGADKEFLIISKSFYQQNNLPKDLNDQVMALLDQSQWQLENIKNKDERQANRLLLQRRQIAFVPAYNPLQHLPAAHPQRAKVVGPQGEEIHVDAWGRIKVRFLFTRAEDHAHDGGAGSNNTDSDSAWVDVLTPWAGEGYGVRLLPRIDEIVVIDFFDGNIDRPFVIGRIHEAQRSPTQFDSKGQLPETKKLSGIRSKEVGGEGFGQLRFDDTNGQISSQLQSSHGASQLNLGHLSHPKEAEESESRGEGFELRTDLAGTIRSKGLYLSTFVQSEAEGTQLETKEALDQFSESLESMKVLSEYAEKQKAEPADMLNHIENYIQKVESQWADLKAMKDAVMLLASPESIAMVSGKGVHINALESITMGSGQSINISTDENLILNAKKKASIFVGQEDFKVYTAKGKMDIQVQDNALDAMARSDITITSSEGKVEINSPTEIVLRAKDSAIRIDGNGVTVITPKAFKSKAGQHIFTSGATESPQLPIFPNNVCWECLARRAAQKGAFINKGDGL